MQPIEFISKWRKSELKERSAAQEHFLDLCRMLGESTPAEADPSGEYYCFERGASKASGGNGWADVWKRGHFGWEYKGLHGNLDRALDQLRQYALALENPPLLVVCDTHRFRIQTNWTNSVSKTYEFELEDLTEPRHRDRLKAVFSDPDKLKPGITRQSLTESAAATFAEIAQALREANHGAELVAQFVNRLVFCMFAEDIGLLPNKMFSRMLSIAEKYPDRSAALASDLFEIMGTGGMIGYEEVKCFNGTLFDTDQALPLSAQQVHKVREAAALDWSDIDPAILGTLFERGLDPDKRKQIGAHYTDREMIMQIIEPVIERPWLAAWREKKSVIAAAIEREQDVEISKAARAKLRARSDQLLLGFLQELRAFRVLDPACGSGNFLYLALVALKDIELRVQVESESMGLARGWPEIGPGSVMGIEINAFAAELARVSVWIGELQWLRRNGFNIERRPILAQLDTIECRDAILASDHTEPDWPTADAVIGNPPFLGYSPMRKTLGNEYTESLRAAYIGSVPAFADLVCYWFHKAGKLVAERKVGRVGLVATNSIRGGRNRVVLDRIQSVGTIYEAWSDEPWVLDGAAVRVSLVCFGTVTSNCERRLNGIPVSRIHANLTSESTDLTRAMGLVRNRDTAFIGDQKTGEFDVPGDLARKWISLPRNPNGCSNSDVLRPWANGRDLTRRTSGKWIIDFGYRTDLRDVSMYEGPFQHIEKHVKPKRENNRNRKLGIVWWIHKNPARRLRESLLGLTRYIATPRNSKHRLFVWLPIQVCPDSTVVAITRDDDTTFGILHSRFHEAWSLRLGTWLGKGNNPRYTPTTSFQTFPFPDGLSPDIRASEYASTPHATAIAAAARDLDDHRTRWLHPSEWVDWIEEPVPGYPRRPVPRSPEASEQLKQRTLTQLYNTRPRWLAELHQVLDAAVAKAYGWTTQVTEDEFLSDLLDRNLRLT